jgi:hypothetical protein
MFDYMASDPMPAHLVELADQLERAYVARQAEGPAEAPPAPRAS